MLGDIQQRLRRKLHHIGHHADVRLQTVHGVVRGLVGELVQLQHVEAARLRLYTQRIGFGTRFFRAAEHAHHLVTARQKGFERGLAEILLTDQNDFHGVGVPCLF